MALMKAASQYRGDVIGWGPWRARWYSICSKHGPGTPEGKRRECRLCLAGHYVNDWTHATDSLIYRRATRFWLWWHNRPNSKSRRRLERIFPGLRRG
jgi:hypothetical protein